MDIIGDSFKNAMNAMSMAMFETLGLYVALPLIGAGVLLRYVFRLKGRAFTFVYGFVVIACMYFFVYKGIPHYQELYDSKLAQ